MSYHRRLTKPDQSEVHMRAAIALAIANVREGRGGPFAALVVKQGEVIARGANQVTATLDPTAHAEIVAIRAACQKLGSFQLQGCDIYSSCEPCPMCLAALYWARPARVFFGSAKQDAALAGFDDQLIYEELALDLATRKLPMRQLLGTEALAAFKEWEKSPLRVEY